MRHPVHTFIFFLAGLGQNSSVLGMLFCPNGPKLDLQHIQLELRAYGPNMYTVAILLDGQGKL